MGAAQVILAFNRFSTNSTISAEVKYHFSWSQGIEAHTYTIHLQDKEIPLRLKQWCRFHVKILRKWMRLNNLSFSQGFVSLYLSYSQKLIATSSPKKIQQKCESNHQTREIPAWMCLKIRVKKTASNHPTNSLQANWHLKEVLPIHRRWNPRPGRYPEGVVPGVVTLPPEIIEMIDFIFRWSKEPETYRAPIGIWNFGWISSWGWEFIPVSLGFYIVILVVRRMLGRHQWY